MLSLGKAGEAAKSMTYFFLKDKAIKHSKGLIALTWLLSQSFLSSVSYMAMPDAPMGSLPPHEKNYEMPYFAGIRFSPHDAMQELVCFEVKAVVRSIKFAVGCFFLRSIKRRIEFIYMEIGVREDLVVRFW